MKVDYLIIGAGLSGLVLWRLLHRRHNVVIVDPNPGGWKIGEANVPEMFASPIFNEILAQAKNLPSFAQKNGSVFIGSDSFAAYPIVTNRDAAVHIARDELEQLMIRLWGVPVEREAVRSIDVEARVVRTDRATYDVAGQILDCSGAAMLVASALGDVRSLWPIHSVWRYYDIEAVEPAAFFRHMDETRRPGLFIDIPNIRLLDPALRATWAPHEATNLTQVEDGTWLWQIPLFGAKMLSAGLVSRYDGCDADKLSRAVEEHHARCYKLAPRPIVPDGPSVYDRVHHRSGFARRAGKASTKNYILVGDAFMFIDPIYSVGTSIAVNKAIEAAALLNDGGFSQAKSDLWCARNEALIARRVGAFEYWYCAEKRDHDENTLRVQHYFPEMTSFQAGITWQYARVVQATLRLTSDVARATKAALLRGA